MAARAPSGVTTVGSGQTVTVGAGQNAQATITNTYTFLTGSLTVTKTINGLAAGEQGPVTIEVSCDGKDLLPDLMVPAGSPAADYTHTYTGIATGSTCTADETFDGSTSTVDVVVTGNGTSVVVPGGGSAALHITDTYTHTTGSLLVTKLIAGPAAGHQDPVTISVTCGASPRPDFTIPAGEVGLVSQVYEDIPAGSTCTVDETFNGSSSTVSVTTVGGNQTVGITAGHQAEADITDTYDFVPGSLTVTKTISVRAQANRERSRSPSPASPAPPRRHFRRLSSSRRAPPVPTATPTTTSRPGRSAPLLEEPDGSHSEFRPSSRAGAEWW